MQEYKRKPVPRVAVIHDMCSVGKAAMTNILPVLSVMGIEVCPVPTMILSTHTGGFGRPVMYPLAEFMGQCGGHLKENGIIFDHIIVGYLGSIAMAEKVQEFLKLYPEAEVLLDPIMADHGSYYMNFDETYGKAIRKLLKWSSVITPNYTESCLLAEIPYDSCCTEEKLRQICRRLAEAGAKQIVITSVPLPEAEMSLAVYEKGELWISRKRPEGRAYPGTGDLFAAVLKGYMIKGGRLCASAEQAHDFVCRCIRTSDACGYPVREGVLLEPNLRYLLSENGEETVHAEKYVRQT